MGAGNIYIIISLIALALIAFILFLFPKKDHNKKLSPLAGLAFACIVAGITFGHERIVGYSLLGMGVLLSVIDIVIKQKGN